MGLHQAKWIATLGLQPGAAQGMPFFLQYHLPRKHYQINLENSNRVAAIDKLFDEERDPG